MVRAMVDFIVQSLPNFGALFLHFAGLSLLSVGGAIMLVPAMHQFFVDDTHWMSTEQFNASVSISQAAPGPNILFVALMGWYAGSAWLAAAIPAASWGLKLAVGVLTALIALTAMMLPSTTLTYFAGRWAHQNQHLTAVKAFKQGMSPIVIGLLIATGWIMARAHGDWHLDWAAWFLTAGAAVLAWRTEVHLLVLLTAGAIVGALGMV
jgi:chromate transporter